MPTIPDQHEMADIAWKQVTEAILTGSFTLPGTKTVITLQTEPLIRLIQWVATTKAKKPSSLPIPEDFTLRKTKGGGDE